MALLVRHVLVICALELLCIHCSSMRLVEDVDYPESESIKQNVKSQNINNVIEIPEYIGNRLEPEDLTSQILDEVPLQGLEKARKRRSLQMDPWLEIDLYPSLTPSPYQQYGFPNYNPSPNSDPTYNNVPAAPCLLNPEEPHSNEDNLDLDPSDLQVTKSRPNDPDYNVNPTYSSGLHPIYPPQGQNNNPSPTTNNPQHISSSRPDIPTYNPSPRPAYYKPGGQNPTQSNSYFPSDPPRYNLPAYNPLLRPPSFKPVLKVIRNLVYARK